MRNAEYAKIPRHPAQLYESLSYLVLFFILYAFWNRYKSQTPRGMLLGLWLIGTFGMRFLFEYLKENQVAFENNLPLNMGQILSIPAVLLGVFLVFRSSRNAAALPPLVEDDGVRTAR